MEEYPCLHMPKAGGICERCSLEKYGILILPKEIIQKKIFQLLLRSEQKNLKEALCITNIEFCTKFEKLKLLSKSRDKFGPCEVCFHKIRSSKNPAKLIGPLGPDFTLCGCRSHRKCCEYVDSNKAFYRHLTVCHRIKNRNLCCMCALPLNKVTKKLACCNRIVHKDCRENEQLQLRHALGCY